jgi:hypothetical protein
MTTPTRWVVRFQIEPGRWMVAGGKPRWTFAKIHSEAEKRFGPVYRGRGIPLHMKAPPRFYRLSGTKGFVRLDRISGEAAFPVRAAPL